MRRISTLELVPGMVTAVNVLGANRQLVIARGTVLTDTLITKLDLYGIISIFVEDDELDNKEVTVAATVAAQDVSYSEKVKNSHEFKEFKASYDLNIDSFKDEINNVVERNAQLDVSEMLKHSLDLLSDSKRQFGILDMLQNMRDYDDSTFAHSMNVALICNLFAGWLKMNAEEIELATACGLFHDIGKLMVPKDIITKPGKLSPEEFAQIQKHPISGYKLLMTQNADLHICYSALMHHERADGTGYPMRLPGPQIDKFAKIVAIADVYDAMTAARVYRGPLCPFRVIEIFEDEGLQKYDVEYLLVFLENVVNSYIKNRCKLSDGREGDIIYINKDKLSRPVIQCGQEYVNLIEHPNLTIESLL